VELSDLHGSLVGLVFGLLPARFLVVEHVLYQKLDSSVENVFLLILVEVLVNLLDLLQLTLLGVDGVLVLVLLLLGLGPLQLDLLLLDGLRVLGYLLV